MPVVRKSNFEEITASQRTGRVLATASQTVHSNQFGVFAEFIGINNDRGNALQHQVARNHGA